MDDKLEDVFNVVHSIYENFFNRKIESILDLGE